MNFLTPIAKNLPLIFIEDTLTKNLYKQLIDFNHVTYGIGLGFSNNQFKNFIGIFKSNTDFTVESRTIKFLPEEFKITLELEAFILHYKNNIVGVFGYCGKTKLMVVNYIDSPNNEVFSKTLRELDLGASSFPKLLIDFSSENFVESTVCEFLASLYNTQSDNKSLERYTVKDFTGMLFIDRENEQNDIKFLTFERTFTKVPELINSSTVNFKEKISTAIGYYFNKDYTEFGHFSLDPQNQVTFSPFYKETKKQS